MDDFERELKEDFLQESLQLLEDSEQAFLALENDKDSTELLDQIFRLAHNLKGTSRAVGFGEVAEFTHEMENLILKLKTGEIDVSDHVVTVLLECNDHITNMISTLRDNLDATFDSVDIIERIKGVLAGETGDSDIAQPEEVTFDESDFEMEVSNEIPDSSLFEEDEASTPVSESAEEDVEISASALESLRELGIYDDSLMGVMDIKTAPADKMDSGLTIKKGDEVVAKKEVAANNVTPIKKEAPPVAAKPTSTPPKKSEDDSIRVALSRVEKLNNVVGELVILQTVLDQRRFTAIQDPLANKSITQLGKLSKEIQEISMSLRMIPLKATLQKMNRIVRDTSKALDKSVNLNLIGEDTEIDKTVLELLADPLVHIVRNAVDHGLESTEGRIKAGKSEVGNVSIKAFHEGNNLAIEITDDGGGINPEVIKRKAIEKGIISATKEVTDDEIIQYIFHPGFSTKEQVTEVSGRGVGMDVVKTNIERMSGDIKVSTKMGEGSIFRINLPLTMAIIDGMIVRVGIEKYILPLSQVHESLKPTPAMINTITGFGECLNLRGEVLPLFNIGKTLGRKMDEGSAVNKIAIIIHNSNFNFAVLVDDILHQQQVVIKKLGDEIKNQKGFVGSSILGDGKPSFILDLNELYSSSLKKGTTTLKENLARVA